ncbi:MAG: hypothetical protein ACHQQS_13445 [Thermoanaerobaculales bacterium]
MQEISAILATFNVDRHNDRLSMDALRSTVRQIGKVARSSFNHSRKLLVRFEKPHGCYLALVHLVAAIICFWETVILDEWALTTATW